MRAEWRKVPGLPWYYEVNKQGKIRSLARIDRRGWKIKTRILAAHDAEVSLTHEDGKHRCYPLAALVLKAFIGPPPAGCYLARHLDDNRGNNNLDNLAWGNDQDNHDDAVRNGASFISYGHKGHTHSEETKKLMSKMRKGIPTGRKMSEAHKQALLQGFRKKFPIKNISLCQCGCKENAPPGKKFIHGHAGRLNFLKINKARIGKARTW
jgi:hypothetical protein